MEDHQQIMDVMKRINKISMQGNRIIEGIYEMCNISKEDIILTLNPLDKIVDDAIDSLDNLIQETNTKIVIDCSHTVLCSLNMLPRVFHNLITNSIKFTKDIRPPEIFIKSFQENNTIKIKIDDNGPGIPKKNRMNLFNAFERLHGEEVEGLGLGLNITKKILAIHNAQIWIEDSSELGGTSFIIKFIEQQKP